MNGSSGGRSLPGTPVTLDDIIDEMVASSPEPSYTALAEWVRRYPQYERELTDFAVAWSLVDRVPAAAEEVREDAASAHMDRVRSLIKDYAPSAVESAAIRGLIAEGQAQGLSARQLAEKSGLSVSLVTKLDRRLIQFASIPREVVSAIAEAINREAQTVARYLQGGALLAPSASYRAEEAPSLPEQQSFAEAVSADRMLSPEDRQRLLSYAPGEE
jgi:hypothetical protein